MFVLIKSVLVFWMLLILLHGYEFIKYSSHHRMIDDKKKKILYILICILLSLLTHWILGMVLYFMLRVGHGNFLSISNKRKKRIIEFNGYKIFKFIMNQVSSGILISEAIKSMYRIVDQPELKQCLIDVSAYYAKTTDLRGSLDILRNRYKGMEVDTLCIAIEQGIHTGTNYDTLKRMELLLFKKYIYQIKLETKLRKKKSILTVLVLCTIMILMVSIPVVIDMINAFNQIFSI